MTDEIGGLECLPGELTAVVAVPVRNERQRVAACLRALDGQRGLPAGRFGRPEEIAATALLLAGPEGGFYVGATLSPNGGDVMY